MVRSRPGADKASRGPRAKRSRPVIIAPTFSRQSRGPDGPACNAISNAVFRSEHQRQSRCTHRWDARGRLREASSRNSFFGEIGPAPAPASFLREADIASRVVYGHLAPYTAIGFAR